MLKRFKVLLASGVLAGGVVVLPVTAAASASAATPAEAVTPGSSCTLWVMTDIWNPGLPGEASANGQDCVPNPQLGGVLAALNVGAPCSEVWVQCEGEPRPW